MTTAPNPPSSSPRKYVPETEGLNQEFFVHCVSGTLHLQRCSDCGTFRHPPRYYCQKCFSNQWSWEPSPGLGTVASWVTSHFTVDRGWVDELPYTTVVVELAEGPRLVGAARGLDEQTISLGLPVRLVGEAKRDDFVFFWVEPYPAAT
ncbi:MAG: Zn-ribbon domain-containing OB-fold protein [Acidimicrobiales bacterium]